MWAWCPIGKSIIKVLQKIWDKSAYKNLYSHDFLENTGGSWLSTDLVKL